MWRKRIKKKVNDVRDMVISVEFNPIEIGFIQASIDIYLEKVNLPLTELMGKACLEKFDKAADELEKIYDWRKIDD